MFNTLNGSRHSSDTSRLRQARLLGFIFPPSTCPAPPLPRVPGCDKVREYTVSFGAIVDKNMYTLLPLPLYNKRTKKNNERDKELVYNILQS